jgi:hypothetical protein
MGRWVLSRVGDGLFEETPGHVRHVGDDPPADTSGWGVRDLWYDTSTEGAPAATWRRWNGTAFVPAP